MRYRAPAAPDLRAFQQAPPSSAKVRVEPGVAPGKPLASDSEVRHEQTNNLLDRRVRRVLVPTEFTARDAKAVRQAVDLALVFRAKLALLHVIDINDPAWLRFSGASDELMRLLRTKAHADMDRLRESLAGRGVDLEFVIVEGMPWEEILLRAECFDLVIMSRPRPRSFWRFFSRQTAKRVIDQAECGIWVVPD